MSSECEEKKLGIENTVEEYLVRHQEGERGRRRGPCQPLWRQTKCFEATQTKWGLPTLFPSVSSVQDSTVWSDAQLHSSINYLEHVKHATDLSMLNTQQILSTIFIIVEEKPSQWFQRIFNQRKIWKRTNCHLQYFKLELLVVWKDTGGKAFSTLTAWLMESKSY